MTASLRASGKSTSKERITETVKVVSALVVSEWEGATGWFSRAACIRLGAPEAANIAAATSSKLIGDLSH